MAKNQTTSNWVGWVYFASALLLILGGLQVVSGLTALFNDQFYLVTNQALVAFDFTTWGWIHLVSGALLIATGVAVAAGKLWAQVIALILAVVSAVATIAFMPAYPIWSIISLVMIGFIVFALALHGDDVATK